MLSSCGSYNSENSRRNTQFYFTDSSSKTGELLGVYGDSVFMIDVWSESPSMIALHYSTLNEVVFFNEASPFVNGLAGIVGGGLLGGIVLGSVGDATDPYRSLPDAPLSYEHQGWGGLTGLIIGVPLGALVGLIVGLDASTDKTIWIDDRPDLIKLSRFARYRTPAELMMYRGY